MQREDNRTTVLDKCHEVAAVIQQQVDTEFAEKYPHSTPDKVGVVERRKFIAIDIGTSGAFLVNRETGEIYNIKAYGVADYNKKKKADLGNVWSVDPTTLYRRWFNYLR